MPNLTPSIGRVVHYVAYGTPGGEFPAGEDAVTLSGCRAPLRDYGYNLDLLEPLVADLAREVLTYVAQVAPTPSGPWRC